MDNKQSMALEVFKYASKPHSGTLCPLRLRRRIYAFVFHKRKEDISLLKLLVTFQTTNQMSTNQLAFLKSFLCVMDFNPYYANNFSKTCEKRPLLKRQKIVFQDQLSLNAGQKYCRMLQREQ